jgi:hypothetical protein
MQVKVRIAGACAAVAIALTGSAAVTPGVARAEINGVCGTLVGAGLTVASVAKTMVQRGAGHIGALVSAGCFVVDLDEAARKYTLTPAAQAEYRRIQERYGHYQVEDFMREWGCAQATRGPSNPDDIYDDGRTRWDCTRSPYAQGD